MNEKLTQRRSLYADKKDKSRTAQKVPNILITESVHDKAISLGEGSSEKKGLISKRRILSKKCNDTSDPDKSTNSIEIDDKSLLSTFNGRYDRSVKQKRSPLHEEVKVSMF